MGAIAQKGKGQTMGGKQSKAGLLKHYATKEPCTFVQCDVFTHTAPDAFMRPDDDGDCVFSGVTDELMTGFYAVRVLITKGTPQDDVKRALQKVARWVNDGGYEHWLKELAQDDGLLPVSEANWPFPVSEDDLPF